MATVAEVLARYRADTAAYVGPVKQATQATQEFARAMPQAAQGADKLKASNVALGAAVGGVAVMALTKATAAVQRFAMQGIMAAADYEQTVISIEGIFRGMGMTVEQATTETATYLGELRDFAARTPFELPQTLDAVKRLLSIGYAANEVKDTILPAVGDITAALGQPASSISAVVYAFGQMKSAGRVMSQDLMQVGNALPGFNAKMAIAKELFNGDVAAMSEAMEKGALDSETAINAIIKAMQKFPGAAGAMERQSKTLLGVMSTFKDTVRNALIDSIVPSLPVLSGALENLVGPVETVAKAFGGALGPNLIKVAEEAQRFAPQLAELAAAMVELAGSGVSNLIQTLGTLAPILQAYATILGTAAKAFNLLPGPMQSVIGLLIAMSMLMRSPMFGPLVTSINGQVKSALTGLRAQIAATRASAIAGFTTMGVAARAGAVVASSAMAGMRVALTGVKTAIRSLWASLGPVGVAIIGLSVAMELFTGNTEEADTTAKDFVSTLTFVNGALDQNSRSMLYNQMAQNGTLTQLQALGISYSDFFTALMKGGPELDAMRNRLVEIEKAGTTVAMTGKTVIATYTAEAQAAQALTGVLGEYSTALGEQASAQAAAAASTETEAALKAHTTASDMMTASTARAISKQSALTAVQNAAADAITAMKTAFDKLNAVIGEEAAYDSAIQSTKDLKKSFEENGKSLKGNSDEALANREAVRQAASAWAAYAQDTEDPIEQQKRLVEGQKAIKEQFKAKGVNVKDSDIYQALKEQQAQAGKTVDEFKEQIPVAKQYGISVGDNFIAGIIAQLEARKSEVTTAAGGVGTAMNAGAEAATKIGSPSKTAAKIAGYWIDGLVNGMTQGEAAAYAKSGKVARKVIDGWRDTMNRYTGGLLTEWGRGLQDAIWAAEDAKDRILDAKKALDDARKEGNAREVAAAERELARAYRDQADAIRAAQEAQKNYDALRKLGKMKPIGAGRLNEFFEIDTTGMDSMTAAQAIVDAMQRGFDAARRMLIERAKRAGMTREAAEAYADRIMETFGRAIEEKQRRLQKAMDKLAKIREQIDKLDQEAGQRKEAGQSIAKFITSRFGETSEFDKAYNAAEMNIDQAAQLFEQFEKLIRERYTGLDTTEDDTMVKFLEDQTRKLVGLIRERDAIKKRLDVAQKDLEDLLKKREDMEKRVSDSIRGFFKASGKIGSADEYIMGLQQRVAATRKYMADIEMLRKRGVAQATIDQILEMGVENGGALAGALATATDEQLAQVNMLTSTAEGLAQTFGQTQADLMYGAGIASQQALVAGIQAEYDAKKAEIQAVVDSIKNMFSMLTDSNLVAGEAAAQALLEGLQSQEKAILTYIQGLAAQIRQALLDAMNVGQSSKNDKERNRRNRSSVPTVRSDGGSTLQIAEGGVQVAVTVGEGQSPQRVEAAVQAAVEKALDRVAQQARNARR